jgi:hypothetical protein
MKSKKLLVAAVALIAVVSLTACSDLPATGDAVSGGTTTTTKEVKKELTFGSVVNFDELEIVIGDQIKWTKLDNQFSDKNGADIAEVPVTIKNLSDETHGLNLFYCNFYGPNGTKLDTVSTYFDNDACTAGDMRPGATQNGFFHILYNGDGDYYVEFNALIGDKVEVKLPIKK